MTNANCDGPDWAIALLDAITRVQTVFVRQADSALAFKLLLEEIVTLTGSVYGGLAEVFEDESGQLRVAVSSFTDNISPQQLAAAYGTADLSSPAGIPEDTLMGQVLETRLPVIAHEPGADPRQSDRARRLAPKLNCFMGLPLFAGTELTGVLCLADRASGYDHQLISALDPILTTAANLISARRQRERRMQIQAQADFSAGLATAVLEGSLDAIVTSDINSKIVEFNPAAERMFGWKQEEVLGKSTRMLTTNNSAKNLDLAAARLKVRQYSNGTNPRVEAEGLRKDGEVFAAEIAVTYSKVHGKPMFTAYVRDISDRKAGLEALRRAKQEAELASEEKGRFVATLSHEIRNPLHALRGSLSMVDVSHLDDADQRCLRLAHESAGVLSDLIENVLDLAKIEAGKVSLQPARARPADIVDNVVSVMAGVVLRNRASLVVFVDPLVPQEVVTDEGRVKQIVMNLVSNAAKHTVDGNVSLRLHAVDGRLRFEVEDDGCGIAASEQHKLFTEFAAIDMQGERPAEGMGLGLAICKHLVNLLGGDIGYRTVAGEGSTFWFEIPYEPVHDSQIQYGGQGIFQGLRVLLAAHEAAGWRALEHQLEAWNIHVTHVLESRLLNDPDSISDDFDLVIVSGTTKQNRSVEALLDQCRRVARKRAVLIVPLGIYVQDQELMAAADYALALPLLGADLVGCLAKVADADLELATTRTGVIPEETLMPVPHGTRILLAEDSYANRVVGEAILRRSGFEVVSVSDGKQAVEALEGEAFDLVLMDIEMPVMDGLQATRCIRNMDDHNRYIPILAITANALNGHRQACLDAGMTGFITKPVDRDRLIAEVVRALAVSHIGTGDTAGMSAEDTRSAKQLVDSEVLFNLERDAAGTPLDGMLRVFVSEARQRSLTIQEAIRKDDVITLERETHALKSTAGTFGICALAALAAHINRLCKSGEGSRALQDASAIAELVDRSLQALESNYDLVHEIAVAGVGG